MSNVYGNHASSEALDRLQLKRYCCRRMVLTHVDLIEKLLQYNRAWPFRSRVDSSALTIHVISRGEIEGTQKRRMKLLLGISCIVLYHRRHDASTVYLMSCFSLDMNAKTITSNRVTHPDAISRSR